jgi:hypothetical protein
MEVLIRWPCPCPTQGQCPYCAGIGYIENWLPVELVKWVKGGKYVICGRRIVSPGQEVDVA